MELTEIQRVIERLPEDQQASLASWMASRDNARWDAELERDFSPGGAGMELLDRVKRDVSKGHSRPFPQVRRRA